MGFQLTLGLKLGSKNTLENYISGSNKAFFDDLEAKLFQGQPFTLYLWGKGGAGKSHILQGACQELAYRGVQAAYIDLSRIKNLEILKGLEPLKMLALDNYEALTPGAVAHLKRFLMTSWPAERQILIAGQNSLPDVFQGIDHMTHYEIQDLNKDDIKHFLKLKAEERGLCITEAIQDFMVKESACSVGGLLSWLDKIESRCDTEKKKLSLKFARNILSGTDSTISP